ncbi:short chain dehydrogenase [Pseudoalteromonas rubra]|uniref:Short chain dehydrogenase n=1 Tax=Pseudoalteromonas rubra TaxID=43658 RepID=A0A5S3WGH7_9GAMM|nr:SDR family oxidoreductase [Pseudoalteromonas rubra]TMP24379.1 short chain dehydrogenase [Pseudoalteromonas rubra]TMP30868.1 short chain dehydrogenase [Pseudoalteromonas rubra]
MSTSNTLLDLTGKVAIVTGSARNMGRAFAISLAERGANVVVHYHSDSSLNDAEQTAAEITQIGRRVLLVQGDLSHESQVQALYRQTLETFGRVDIVINNAGKVLKKAIADISEQEYDQLFAINTKAPFLMMKHAATHIQDQGRIINMGTSLLGAFTGLYGAYAGAKAPLEDFTRALAKEIGGRGITVNVVAPGPIDTAFFHGEENAQSVAYLSAASVLNRLGNIDDVVPMIDFLVSEEARWITGQTLFVNGGFVTR